MKHLMFAAQLIEQANLGEPGVDLFVTTMPADITRGAMLVDPIAGHEIDEGMRGFFTSTMQLVVRDPDVEAGYARALAISGVLTIGGQDSDGIYVAWLRPMTLPVSYPRGAADEIETSVRFRIGFGLK